MKRERNIRATAICAFLGRYVLAVLLGHMARWEMSKCVVVQWHILLFSKIIFFGFPYVPFENNKILRSNLTFSRLISLPEVQSFLVVIVYSVPHIVYQQLH